MVKKGEILVTVAVVAAIAVVAVAVVAIAVVFFYLFSKDTSFST